MSHFYGVVKGGRGAATRCGHKNTGMHTQAKTWDGLIETHLTHVDGEDHYEITITDRKGYRVLARGTLNGCRWCDDGVNCTQHKLKKEMIS